MRWSIILLAAVSLAGCNQKPDSTAQEAPAKAATEAAHDAEESAKAPEAPPAEAQPEPSAPAPPTIKLVKPGKKPRRALRWSPPPGEKERLTMRVDTELEAVVAMLNAQAAPRSLRFELTVQSSQAVRDGTQEFAFTVDEARLLGAKKLPDRARKALQEATATLRGLQGSYLVDALGTVEKVVINLPSDASRDLWGIAWDLEWALRHLALPFPEEPIGTGARWTIDRGVKHGVIQATEASTFKITKLKKQLVTLKTKVQQTASPMVALLWHRFPQGSQVRVKLARTETGARKAGEASRKGRARFRSRPSSGWQQTRRPRPLPRERRWCSCGTRF